MTKVITKIFLVLMMLTWADCSMAQFVMPRHEATEWTPFTLEEMQGEVRIPVLFLNFEQDNNDTQRAVSATQQESWMEHLNERDDDNHMGEDGSVNDYFLAQSYGKLNVVFENVGSYTASGKGANYTDYTEDAKLVAKAVKSLTDVDWSRYDRNGDKDVDCLLVIFAGHADGDYNTARRAVTSMYPHQNWLTNRGQQKADVGDGYKVQTYVLANNMRDSSASVDAINTVCHELSHGIFDLPDYYKNGVSYMGQYDAMCYGMRQTGYGAKGNHCCEFTSFNRMFLGWFTPAVLTDPCHVVLRPLSKNEDACIVTDPADATHFYMLENRAKLDDSWDKNLPAGGLVVIEIKFSRNNFASHTVNSGPRKHVALVSAETNKPVAYQQSTYYNNDQSVVPFGINGHNEIPSAVNSIFATKTVTNITVNADGTVEFDFMGGGETIDLGIERNTLQENDSQSLCDLSGCILPREPRTGVYIKGGKKYLVK